MNCKQGDLAIVVRSYTGNEGKVVRCLEHVPCGYEHQKGRRLNALMGESWRIDILLDAKDVASGVVRHIPYVGDCQLMPIKDQPGEDETLAWAGRPQKVTA